MTHVIPYGTTEPQDFQLKDGTSNIVGTGLTVTLDIYSGSTPVASPPTVAWLDQAAGTVRVTGAGTLATGTYTVRYKLTDGTGKYGYAPNGRAGDTWYVVRVAQR